MSVSANRSYYVSMNFSSSDDDIDRFSSAEDLIGYYRSFGLDGLELMPFGYEGSYGLRPEMIVGVHMVCPSDWMSMDRDELMKLYRESLAEAVRMEAKYVVFHITQVAWDESWFYRKDHTNEEVIRACADIINELLDGKDYSFDFLMENLWWPGLTFLNPDETKLLLSLVHYEKKGLMLDTGHFIHTNPDLRSQDEAIAYLNGMLDTHEEFIPLIKGIHLQQSLSGEYVQNHLAHLPELSEDSNERFSQFYNHIYAIDRHQPFTAEGVPALISRIDPSYVTLEYISRSREEHAAYLRAGTDALNMHEDIFRR